MSRLFDLIVWTICVLFSGAVMAVSEPDFVSLKREDAFELREYPGFVVAETYVEGDFDAAGRTGFRRVAGYIFGNNRTSTGEADKIAMTAPVTVEPSPPGEPLPAQPIVLQADADRWRLHFVMPSGSSLDSLPAPTDPRVQLREIPKHRVASIRFSGLTTRARMTSHTEQLQAWIEAQGLVPVAAPQVARYNDPFTLPWNRRNEILIEVQ